MAQGTQSTQRTKSGAASATGAGAAARQTAAEVRPWLVKLARFGEASRGFVYALVGLLAARAALGAGGEVTGTKGAITTLVDAPFGRALLGVLAVGLAGYALWKGLRGVLDPEHRGTDGKGIAKRLADVLGAIVYGGLAVAALRLATGSGRGGGEGEQAVGLTARLMSQPFGVFLVALAGAALAVYGLSQISSGLSGKFRRHLKLDEMSPSERTWANRAGQIGLPARGAIFVMMGIFLGRAALQADPGEARGLGGALDTLAASPAGPWLLGIAALGLIAYGLYGFVLARYRRMVAPI